MLNWIPNTFTKNNDKVEFLLKFIEDEDDILESSLPLMIVGEGGTGKSEVLNEVCSLTNVNIILIRNGSFEFCHAATGPSGRCAYLIESNGSDEDYQFARYARAYIVRFEKDPDYV
jgi:hypothetical protein